MAYGINNEVNERANAFRGNPQALAQRYDKDQQLIDLLALQKIKSDMDAAKRQITMQSAQQGQPPTVKAQREREVFDMTKEDVAKRVTDVAQQKQQEEQKKIQELMQSGIAQAPAPNMMQMAGGGIVAFAGEDGSYVEDKEERIPPPPPRVNPVTRQMNPAYEAWVRKYFGVSTQEYERAQREKDIETRRGISTPYEEFTKIRNQTPTGDRPGPVRPIEGFDISKEEFGFGRPSPRPAAPPAAPTAAGVTQERPPMPDETDAETARLRRQAAPRPAVPPPAPPPAPRPAPRPAAAAPGIPSLPAAPAAAAAPTAEQGIASLQGPLVEAAKRDIGLDPQARQQSEEERIRKMYQETLGTPEEQRQQRLKQFLLGAANRGSLGSVMSGGLAGSLREQGRQREELQGAIGKGISGGQKTYEQTSLDKRQAVQSGTQLVDGALNRAFQEKKLLSDREIAQLNARVEQEKAAATRAVAEANQRTNDIRVNENTLAVLNRAITAETTRIAQEAKRSLAYQSALMKVQSAKNDKERQAAQAELDRLLRQAEAEATKSTLGMREQADRIEQRIMAGGGVDTSQFKLIGKQPQ
jgi:hypothetical protein